MSVAEPQPAARAYDYFEQLYDDHQLLLERELSARWQRGEVEDIAAFVARARATGAVLRWLDERRTAQTIVDYWVTRLYRRGELSASARLAPFDPERAPTLPDSACPYVGLAAFTEDSQKLFFGRRHFVAGLVERLEQGSFVAVVGRSGSGKSSAVRAGLIRALREEGALPGSKDWKYLPTVFPGAEPLANLARMAIALVNPNPERAEAFAQKRAAAMRRDPGHLLKMLSLVTERPAVLVIDQFEELFTLCADPRERQAFVANLLALIDAPGSRHRLIVTMRSEYEGDVEALPGFSERFHRAEVKITPLSAQELRDAIVEPARGVGLTFDDEVVNRLIDETVWTPASLPLLQFSLKQLWNAREGNRITLAVYEKVGGGRQALRRAADQLFEGMIHEEQVVAERILLRMVQPADPSQLGLAVPPEELEVTSSRVRRSDLYTTGGRSEVTDAVLGKLLDAGLVRESGPFLEIAHEALIRNWPRLEGWLRRDREKLLKRRHLRDAARLWVSGGRLDEQVLRGERLVEAGAMRDLTPDERELIVASRRVVEAERQRQQEEEQRAHELERQRIQIESKEQANRALRTTNLRLLWAAALIALFALATIALGVRLSYALGDASRQRDQNEQLANTNEALAATNQVQADNNERDVALAQAAQQTANSEKSTLLNALNSARSSGTAAAATSQSMSELLAAQETALAAQETALAAQATSLQPSVVPTVEVPQPTPTVDVQPDQLAALLGQARASMDAGNHTTALRLAVEAARLDARAAMDDLQRAVQLADPNVITVDDGPVVSASWDLSGQYLVISSGSNVRIFDRNNRGLALATLRHGATVTAAAWASNDNLVLTADEEGTVRVWDLRATLRDSSRPRVLASLYIYPANMVLGAAWSPDDSMIVAGTQRQINLWQRPGSEWSDSAPLLQSIPSAGAFSRAAWSSDGQSFVAAGPAGRIWYADGQALPNSAFGPLNSAAWSSGGPRVATVGSACNPTCSATVWDVTPSGVVATANLGLQGEHSAPLNDVMLSPDGGMAVTASQDGTALVWDARGGPPLLRLAANGDVVLAATWNPLLPMIVTGNADGAARIFYTDPLELLRYAELVLTQISA